MLFVGGVLAVVAVPSLVGTWRLAPSQKDASAHVPAPVGTPSGGLK